jgi:dolichol-phosphate mannosyltransferase
MNEHHVLPALQPDPPNACRVSIVVPVHNEEGNLARLIGEIAGALDKARDFEILYVNDGSIDETAVILANLRGTYPMLRVLSHAVAAGQSAAIRSGVLAARGAIIVTLDGDGQNNPAFIPAMIAKLEAGEKAIGLVQGQRLGRKDSPFKRWQSRQANRIRGAILHDGTRDTGCGLKVFWRDLYLRLPYFDAIHRFMPALVKREGYGVALHDVVDRPRGTGQSKYGFWGRLRLGALDLMGVWWLIRRKKPAPVVIEIAALEHVS